MENQPKDEEQKVTASSPQTLLDQSSSTMSTTGPVYCDDPTDRTERGDDVADTQPHKIFQWQTPAQAKRGIHLTYHMSLHIGLNQCCI